MIYSQNGYTGQNKFSLSHTQALRLPKTHLAGTNMLRIILHTTLTRFLWNVTTDDNSDNYIKSINENFGQYPPAQD